MSTPRSGAANVLSGNAVRLVLSGVATLVIAVIIGPSAKGILATLASISAIGATMIGLGTGGAVPFYVATRKWTLAQANAVTLAWTLASGLVAWVAFSVLRSTIGGAVLEGLDDVVLVAATSAMLLASLSGQSLLAIKEFKLYARFAMLGAVANPLVFAGLLLAGTGRLPSALWGWVASQAVTAACCQGVLLQRGGWRLAAPGDPRGALWYGVRSLGWDLLNLINLRLDVLLLRLLSTASATGAYALAVQFAELVWLIPTSVGAAVFPEVADGGHEGGAWTARVNRLTGALSLMLTVLIGAAGTAVIVLFLPKYAGAIAALWLLLPGTVAASTSKILGNHLNAVRMPQALLWAGVAGVTVTLGGDLLLVPLMGAAGAAVVSSVSYAACAIVLVRYFVRSSDIRARELAPGLGEARESVWLAVRTAREFLRRATEAGEA